MFVLKGRRGVSQSDFNLQSVLKTDKWFEWDELVHHESTLKTVLQLIRNTLLDSVSQSLTVHELCCPKGLRAAGLFLGLVLKLKKRVEETHLAPHRLDRQPCER